MTWEWVHFFRIGLKQMDWISRICVVTIFFAFFKYQYCSISPFSRQKLGTNGITAVIDCQFFWRPKMNERFYTYNYVPTYQLPVDASYIYAFTGKICQCHSIPNSRNVRYCWIHSLWGKNEETFWAQPDLHRYIIKLQMALVFYLTHFVLR